MPERRTCTWGLRSVKIRLKICVLKSVSSSPPQPLRSGPNPDHSRFSLLRARQSEGIYSPASDSPAMRLFARNHFGRIEIRSCNLQSAASSIYKRLGVRMLSRGMMAWSWDLEIWSGSLSLSSHDTIIERRPPEYDWAITPSPQVLNRPPRTPQASGSPL